MKKKDSVVYSWIFLLKLNFIFQIMFISLTFLKLKKSPHKSLSDLVRIDILSTLAWMVGDIGLEPMTPCL